MSIRATQHLVVKVIQTLISKTPIETHLAARSRIVLPVYLLDCVLSLSVYSFAAVDVKHSSARAFEQLHA